MVVFTDCLKENGMSSIKTISASQAYNIRQYKKIKGKILKCNTNLCFNKQHVTKHI